MKNNLSFVCSFFVGFVLLSGCADSTKPAGFPDTVSCVISLTQENAPLSKATIQLIPADGARDWMCSAMTDESGQAAMFTYGRYEGAPEGKFKVVVTKTESDASKFTMPDETDLAAMEKYNRNIRTERLKDYTVIETIYTNSDTTPLELEVKGKTAQAFDVGKKIRQVIN